MMIIDLLPDNPIARNGIVFGCVLLVALLATFVILYLLEGND